MFHTFSPVLNSIFRGFKNCPKMDFSSYQKLSQIGLFEPFVGPRLLRILSQIGLFELVLKIKVCSNLSQIGLLHACLSPDKMKKGEKMSQIGNPYVYFFGIPTKYQYNLNQIIVTVATSLFKITNIINAAELISYPRTAATNCLHNSQHVVQGRTDHLAYRAYARWGVQYWGRLGPFGALIMHQNALMPLGRGA